MKRKIISFFTALSMTLMLFAGMPTGVSAEDFHQHKICADSDHANCSHLPKKYDPFPTGDDSPNTITSDKNYYLTDDLTDDTLINKYIYMLTMQPLIFALTDTQSAQRALWFIITAY